jgi:pilus assembly protein Flp/PilA
MAALRPSRKAVFKRFSQLLNNSSKCYQSSICSNGPAFRKVRFIAEMNSSETIRATVELPCSIRLSGSGHRIVRGVTEELAREYLIVVAPSLKVHGWLSQGVIVSIAVELPSKGTVEPRVLECAATVCDVRAFSSRARILAAIHRMSVHRLNPEPRVFGAQPFPATDRPLNNNPVIRQNHRTNLNQTGENAMSFLKNLFVEEDGQDMVEYGLVIALVVLGAVVALTGLSGKITTGFNTMGTAIGAVTNF